MKDAEIGNSTAALSPGASQGTAERSAMTHCHAVWRTLNPGRCPANALRLLGCQDGWINGCLTNCCHAHDTTGGFQAAYLGDYLSSRLVLHLLSLIPCLGTFILGKSTYNHLHARHLWLDKLTGNTSFYRVVIDKLTDPARHECTASNATSLTLTASSLSQDTSHIICGVLRRTFGVLRRAKSFCVLRIAKISCYSTQL